jgi:hypothetical protein
MRIPLYSSPLGCEIGNFCRLLSAAVRTVEQASSNEVLTVDSKTIALRVTVGGGGVIVDRHRRDEPGHTV